MIFGNWETTLAGWVLGMFHYLNAAGMNLPTTWPEVKAAVFSILLAALGTATKSANVGSKG